MTKTKLKAQESTVKLSTEQRVWLCRAIGEGIFAKATIYQDQALVFAIPGYDDIARFIDNIAIDCRALIRIEKSLHRVGENQCNGHFYYSLPYNLNDSQKATIAKWELALDAKEERLFARAKAIGDKYGIAVIQQGDPRGIALQVNPNPSADPHKDSGWSYVVSGGKR